MAMKRSLAPGAFGPRANGGGGGGGDYVLWSGNIGNGFSNVLSVYPGLNASPNIAMPEAGSAASGIADVVSNTLDGNAVYTLQLNGVNTGMSVTIGAAVTGVIDFTGAPIAFSKNDRIGLFADSTAATAGSIQARILVPYKA